MTFFGIYSALTSLWKIPKHSMACCLPEIEVRSQNKGFTRLKGQLRPPPIRETSLVSFVHVFSPHNDNIRTIFGVKDKNCLQVQKKTIGESPIQGLECGNAFQLRRMKLSRIQGLIYTYPSMDVAYKTLASAINRLRRR